MKQKPETTPKIVKNTELLDPASIDQMNSVGEIVHIGELSHQECLNILKEYVGFSSSPFINKEWSVREMWLAEAILGNGAPRDLVVNCVGKLPWRAKTICIKKTEQYKARHKAVLEKANSLYEEQRVKRYKYGDPQYEADQVHYRIACMGLSLVPWRVLIDVIDGKAVMGICLLFWKIYQNNVTQKEFILAVKEHLPEVMDYCPGFIKGRIQEQEMKSI